MKTYSIRLTVGGTTYTVLTGLREGEAILALSRLQGTERGGERYTMVG